MSELSNNTCFDYCRLVLLPCKAWHCRVVYQTKGWSTVAMPLKAELAWYTFQTIPLMQTQCLNATSNSIQLLCAKTHKSSVSSILPLIANQPVTKDSIRRASTLSFRSNIWRQHSTLHEQGLQMWVYVSDACDRILPLNFGSVFFSQHIFRNSIRAKSL